LRALGLKTVSLFCNILTLFSLKMCPEIKNFQKIYDLTGAIHFGKLSADSFRQSLFWQSLFPQILNRQILFQ
jgi:hypothetical protein